MKNSIINRQFKYSYNNATLFIILINLVVFIITNIFPSLLYYLSMVPLYIYFKHWMWQFFTYMFVHGSFWHLLSNMLGVFIFGRIVERRIGTKEFVLYYLLTGTLSSVSSYFVYLYTGQAYSVVLGASGAMYALLLLFSVLFPRAVLLLLGIIPIKAPVLLLIYFLIDFCSQVSGGTGAAYLVHLFGLFWGLLYVTIRMRMNPLKQWGLM